jgi:hypothetical protein
MIFFFRYFLIAVTFCILAKQWYWPLQIPFLVGIQDRVRATFTAEVNPFGQPFVIQNMCSLYGFYGLCQFLGLQY